MRISDWSSDVCSSDLDLLRQVAGQKAQTLSGFYGRACQHQALHGFALQCIDGASHGQPGLARAGGAYAEGDVVPQNLIQVVALARRRSEERRVGKECVRNCKSRCSPEY